MTKQEQHEFIFNWDALVAEDPRVASDMRALLDALCKLNPRVPRAVCATLGAQIVAANVAPVAGSEAAFLADLTWLQEQGGGMEICDGTPGKRWTKETQGGAQ